MRAGEVVREEVHALARQVARELVHRHELGMHVRPELLLALRQLAPALAVDGGIARHRQRMERLPRERRAQRRDRARAARGGSSCRCGAARRRTGARRSARRGSPGSSFHAACSRNHVWSMRSTSPRVMTRPTRCSCDSVSIESRSRRYVSSQPGQSSAPRSSRPVDVRARSSSISSASRLTIRAGSPVVSPNRFIRRTQSGCVSSFILAVWPRPGAARSLRQAGVLDAAKRGRRHVRERGAVGVGTACRC